MAYVLYSTSKNPITAYHLKSSTVLIPNGSRFFSYYFGKMRNENKNHPFDNAQNV